MMAIIIYGQEIETRDQYLRAQRRALKRTPAKTATTTPEVLVQEDAMRIKCPCGNYPMVLEAAKMACCLLCGLIYEGLDVPTEAIPPEEVPTEGVG
jgi:hypothetical protein